MTGTQGHLSKVDLALFNWKCKTHGFEQPMIFNKTIQNRMVKHVEVTLENKLTQTIDRQLQKSSASVWSYVKTWGIIILLCGFLYTILLHSCLCAIMPCCLADHSHQSRVSPTKTLQTTPTKALLSFPKTASCSRVGTNGGFD